MTVVALGLSAATASAQSGSKPTSSGGYVPAAPPLVVGDRATSFNVIDDRGRTGPVTSLAQRGKQTVIVFSRGSFCPYCMAHLTELQAAYDRIKADAELIVVFREESKGT
ncbi:MAG: redoxin domain-containing protein, partial [Planctomycetota bacterium]